MQQFRPTLVRGLLDAGWSIEDAHLIRRQWGPWLRRIWRLANNHARPARLIFETSLTGRFIDHATYQFPGPDPEFVVTRSATALTTLAIRRPASATRALQIPGVEPFGGLANVGRECRA